jgi:uncharacterized radical SAM superfamily Fe-S cluster-containing enzyme
MLDTHQHSELIHRIIDFVYGDEQLYSEFQEYGNTHFADEGVVQSEQTMNMSFNSFLYDCKKDGESVLMRIVSRYSQKFSDMETAYLNTIDKNWYGLFEVLHIVTGTGFSLRDVLSGKVYEVSEISGSRDASVGDLLFSRMADRGDAHILLYTDGKYPLEAGYTLKRFFKSSSEPLSTPLIAQYFYRRGSGPGAEPDVNPEKHLKRLLKKYLGKKFRITALKEQFIDSPENTGEIISSFLRQYSQAIPSYELEKIEEALLAYVSDLFDKECTAGPLEKMITEQLFAESQQHFEGLFSESDAPSKQVVDAFAEQWISSPQEELGGKTPGEVVENERRGLGITDAYTPDLVFRVSKAFNPVYEEYEKALRFLKADEPKNALPLFLRLYEDEELRVAPLCHNIGACYMNIYSDDKKKPAALLKKAKVWLERALKLDKTNKLSKGALEECERILVLAKTAGMLKKGMKAREKVMIPRDVLQAMPLDALEKELQKRILDFSREEFLELAEGVWDHFELSDVYYEDDRFTAEGLDEDNIVHLLDEYWSRLRSDKTDFHFLEDYVEQHLEFSEDADLEKEISFDELLGYLKTLQGRLESVSDTERMKLIRYLLHKHPIIDYRYMLCSALPMAVHNATGWGEKRLEMFDVLFDMFGDNEILYFKADVLEMVGRVEEALELLERLFAEGDMEAKLRMGYLYSQREHRSDLLKARAIAMEVKDKRADFGMSKMATVDFVYDILSNIGERKTRKEVKEML